VRWQFSPEGPEDNAIRARFAQKTGASGGASDPSAISHVGHARQLTDFVQAIQTGRAPAVDGREGRRAVEVIVSVYEANRTGRLVELAGT
jgi:predicted dehydrogenase